MKRAIFIAILIFAQSAVAAITIPVTFTTSTRDVTLQLEIAVTPETRAYGLMNRNTLKPNDGMLFMFPEAQRLYFWMKNTLIPLDMIFMGRGGTIMRIEANTTPRSLKPIDSGGPSYTVIEIDGGRAKREGIAVGNRVSFRFQEDTHVE